MSLLSMLKRDKWSIGIDVGSEYISMIGLAKKNSDHQLVAHGHFHKTNLGPLQQLLRVGETHDLDIRVGIDDPKVKMQKIEIPEVPDDEIDAVVPWAVQDALKIPIDNYVVRHYQLAKHERSVSFAAFAVEKERLNEYLGELKQLGLRPNVIEPHIHALANGLRFSHELGDADRVALIDFGKTLIGLAIVSSAGLLFYRPFSGVSGKTLQSQINLELGADAKDAKALLSSDKSLSSDEAAKLAGAVSRYFSKLAIETQYSIENYKTQFPGQPVNRLMLAGEDAHVSGLKEHLETTFRLPTEFLDIFKKIDTSNFSPDDLHSAKKYCGVAFGLAL